MVLGGGVIGVSIIATLEIALLLGIALIISGAAQLFHISRFTRAWGWGSRLLLAAISIVAGVVILRNPMVGALAMTLAMASYFLLAAVGRAVLALEASEAKGRTWLILSALVSFVLGLYLIGTLPVSSLYIPGTLLGIDLIFYGASLTALSANRRDETLSLEPHQTRKVA